MKNLAKYFRQSLSVRLSLWIVLFATIIFIGALGHMFEESREAVRDEAINRANQVLENTVLRVNRILEQVEIATRNAMWLPTSHLDAPDSMYVYSRHILENNPDLFGCSIAFEPYYFKDRGQYFSAYSEYSETEAGVIDSYQEGNDDYQYFCMDWYLLPKLLDKPCWTEPYIDLDPDTVYVKEMILSYGIPLKDKNGTFVGVISTDISLHWLSQVISAVKPYPHSYSVMTGRGCTYLVHPDSTKLFYETIFTETLEKPDSVVTALGHAMHAGEEGMKQMKIDGENCFVFYKPLKKTQWSVAIVCPESDIFGGFNRLRRAVTMIVLIGLILMLYIVSRIITRELKPLRLLASQTKVIASGQFDQNLPDDGRIDEIGNLTRSFGEMQHSLVCYIDELKNTTAAKERIESELEVASNIQMSMIPKKFPESLDVDIYASISPAKEVGGDLYDFFQKDDTLYFCIGDVSGKGVPASLLMTVTTSQFRTVSRYLSQPDEMMMAINNQIAEGNDTRMFVTLFIGCLDLKTGHLTYCCGGHIPPLLIDSDVKGLPVAFRLPVGAIKGMKYVFQETQIAPGTTLFLFTDGLTEAMDASFNMFGDNRLKKIAQNMITAGEVTPKALIDRLSDAVETFVNGAPQSDDLTMLAIQYKGHDK